MHAIRMSVLENRLQSVALSEADYVHAIEVTGTGWVIKADGQVVAFAVGNSSNGNVWALFVHPEHERRGYGRRLHDMLVSALRRQGLRQLWLTTEPGTRAERFYLSAGWERAGITDSGEVRFELSL